MISIVIPIFNEEENIQNLFKRIVDSSKMWNDNFEVLLVNDGSSDSSLQLMTEINEHDDRFKIVNLSRNFGHQAAITAGIKLASGDAVIVMDGDLQDPPEELHRFIDKWREGFDVIYAIREKRKESFFKKIAYKLFYRILRIVSEIDIPLDSGDFCVMDRKVVNVLNNEMPEKSRFVRGLRAFAGFKQVGVKYERAERAAGEVKYTLSKLIKLAIDGIFDFSTLPLRIAIYLGLTVAGLSFLIGIYMIIHKLFKVEFFGYAPAETPGIITLAIGIFFLGGLTLIVLGVIGEYIGRIYFEVKRRPFYIVEEFYTKKIKK